MKESDWKLVWEVIKGRLTDICDLNLKEEYHPLPYALIKAVKKAIEDKKKFVKCSPV